MSIKGNYPLTCYLLLLGSINVKRDFVLPIVLELYVLNQCTSMLLINLLLFSMNAPDMVNAPMVLARVIMIGEETIAACAFERIVQASDRLTFPYKTANAEMRTLAARIVL